MISVFDFDDYRTFLRTRIEQMPKGGFGQGRKLAKYLDVHTSLISQVLNGQKELSSDLAAGWAEFLGLQELETDYFLSLVQLERAGTERMRKIAKRHIADIKKKAADLDQRNTYPKILSDEHRAVFYSSWLYSAVRQMSALGSGTTSDEISEQLQIPLLVANQVVEFLLISGLCLEKKGKVVIGPVRTFLDKASPWARVYHRNWRDRASLNLERSQVNSFHYTSPVTLSKADAEKIRAMLVEAVQNINSVIDSSTSEEMRCLCIDWFHPTST